MRNIMLMNAKGGCGKTTLATNIATWLADEGAQVALADYDPQGSSLDWLTARNDYQGIPQIIGIDACQGAVRAPRGCDYLVMDVPAGIHGKQINQMLRRVDDLIVPVLPSPLDMRACSRYLSELLTSGRISRNQTRVAIVANRVRENTRIYHQLEAYLGHLKLPILTHLRESQNYIRSAETGLGITEMAPAQMQPDVASWEPLMAWIYKRR